MPQNGIPHFVWYPFLFPSFFISVRLCFCGKCLSFPAMCQNNPLPNTSCGSRNRAHPSQESTPLSTRHRLHVFFLNECSKLCENKARYHFTQDISCFTLLKQTTNSWNKFWTLHTQTRCHFNEDISLTSHCFQILFLQTI